MIVGVTGATFQKEKRSDALKETARNKKPLRTTTETFDEIFDKASYDLKVKEEWR